MSVEDDTKTTAAEPLLIAADDMFEEEHILLKESIEFYPARLGEVLGSRYRLFLKLGWGSLATVWLAKDLQSSESGHHYVAIKICAANHADPGLERDLLEDIAAANPTHPGIQYIRLLLHSFEVQSPFGSHTCLVFPPLREPLNVLQKRLVDCCYTLPPLRAHLKALLLALSYLHDECQMVHTDIKPENILVAFEKNFDWAKLEKQERELPPPRKILSDRIIYESRPSFGFPQGRLGLPKLTDFDLAVSCRDGLRYGHTIQLASYRAPEVVLGQAWYYPADIWSAAAMSFELLENKPLCDGIGEDGVYSERCHVAKLIGLLGEPPASFAKLGEHSRDFFDENGVLLSEVRRLVPSVSLEDSITRLSGETKRDFVVFLRRMLQWEPEARATAAGLLKDPMLSTMSLGP